VDVVMTDVMVDLLPEWPPFREAVTARRPDHGTACEGWTVRVLVAHNAGTAEELARVLGAHLEGRPASPTRSFEERELRFRSLPDNELMAALDREVCSLGSVLEEASRCDPEAFVPWTGREMKVAWFGEHMREELILHRWDMVGDDGVSAQLLSQPWVTEHSVVAVGRPLLRKGLALRGAGAEVAFRLRTPERDDVIVSVCGDAIDVELGPPQGPAVLETDAAARVLLLWGRQPSDMTRVTSAAGPDALGEARQLLSGY
jgi:hypothetical protein